MTTLEQWVAETRDHLDGNRSEQANRVGSYTAGSGTLTMLDAVGNIGPGTYLSIGLNDLIVTEVNQLTKTATVVGGRRGSTDVSAVAGDMVRISPRFSDHQILRALNRHLPTLSSPRVGLFQVASTLLPYTSTIQGYNLAGVTDLVNVLQVRRQTYGPSLAWPTIDAWDLMRSADVGDFPSGLALRVQEGHTGLDVQLVYGKAFTPIAANLAANVSTTGVTTHMEDIPPLGAAYRLMAGREIPRNAASAQGDARRAEEVPPGAVARSYAGVAGLWSQRVEEESSRLRRDYPATW